MGLKIKYIICVQSQFKKKRKTPVLGLRSVFYEDVCNSMCYFVFVFGSLEDVVNISLFIFI